MCPFRHISGEKTVVCKHWLRGLCKKGDQCEFLHEYDMTKMPECYFYSKFGKSGGVLGGFGCSGPLYLSVSAIFAVLGQNLASRAGSLVRASLLSVRTSCKSLWHFTV